MADDAPALGKKFRDGACGRASSEATNPHARAGRNIGCGAPPGTASAKPGKLWTVPTHDAAADYKRPKAVMFVASEDFPGNATGTVKRHEL